MSEEDTCASYVFTSEQIHSFKEDGFIIIHKYVADELINKSKQMILHKMGAHGHPAKNNNLDGVPLTPEEHKIVWEDVMNSVNPLLYALVGEGPSLENGSGQLALRFPSDPRLDAENTKLIIGSHIDGMKNHEFSVFSALIGVCMSEQMGPLEGNFVVYPKSHLKSSFFFKNQWLEQKRAGKPERDIRVGPEGPGWIDKAIFPTGAIDGIEPLQVMLSPGDVVLAHHHLVHCFADNRSDRIRCNMYWRIRHVDMQGFMCNLDLWHRFAPEFSGWIRVRKSRWDEQDHLISAAQAVGLPGLPIRLQNEKTKMFLISESDSSVTCGDCPVDIDNDRAGTEVWYLLHHEKGHALRSRQGKYLSVSADGKSVETVSEMHSGDYLTVKAVPPNLMTGVVKTANAHFVGSLENDKVEVFPKAESAFQMFTIWRSVLSGDSLSHAFQH